MPQVNWVERQVRRADRFQQRHAVLAFPWAVAQKFGNDQAGGKAALMAYNVVLEVRRPEEKVIASFTEAADEDPLDNLDDGG